MAWAAEHKPRMCPAQLPGRQAVKLPGASGKLAGLSSGDFMLLIMRTKIQSGLVLPQQRAGLPNVDCITSFNSSLRDTGYSDQQVAPS